MKKNIHEFLSNFENWDNQFIYLFIIDCKRNLPDNNNILL